MIEKKLVKVVVTPTKEQAADIFTKSLEHSKWADALKMLGMN